MAYRVFLYRTTGISKDAPCIGFINDELRHLRLKSDGFRSMVDMDCPTIIAQLKVDLDEKSVETDGYRIVEKEVYYGDEKRRCIYIGTDYDHVSDILPIIHSFAVQNDLVMFDASSGKVFYRDMLDLRYIQYQKRRQELQNSIFSTMKPVRSVRKLEQEREHPQFICSYVITICKNRSKPFEERVTELYHWLHSAICDGEELVCEDRCFKIKHEDYVISYCLEGYKKRSNRIGFIKNGVAKAEMIRRMSCEEAFAFGNTLQEEEKTDFFSRMYFREMKYKYPNPADRLVASANITKQQRRSPFSVRYSDIGYYGSEILFHVVPDEFAQNGKEISVLKIEEMDAPIVLTFVEKYYPYFGRRYYLTPNHIPGEMMQDIVSDMKKVVDLILHDPDNKKLKPYIKKFDLWTLLTDEEKSENIRDSRVRLRHFMKYRYNVAELLNGFVSWAEAQLWAYGLDDLMFNIQGP